MKKQEEKYKKKNKKDFNHVSYFLDFSNKLTKVFYSENSKFFTQNETSDKDEKNLFYKKTPTRLIGKKTKSSNVIKPNFSSTSLSSGCENATILNFRKEQSLFYNKNKQPSKEKTNILIFGSLRNAIEKNFKR